MVNDKAKEIIERSDSINLDHGIQLLLSKEDYLIVQANSAVSMEIFKQLKKKNLILSQKMEES